MPCLLYTSMVLFCGFEHRGIIPCHTFFKRKRFRQFPNTVLFDHNNFQRISVDGVGNGIPAILLLGYPFVPSDNRGFCGCFCSVVRKDETCDVALRYPTGDTVINEMCIRDRDGAGPVNAGRGGNNGNRSWDTVVSQLLLYKEGGGSQPR